jgi:hypothetical protein
LENSTEKLFFNCSPDRAGILLKSRRAKEIKAMAGQDVLKKRVGVLLKKNLDIAVEIWCIVP